jgi:hypothetical protein
MDATAPNEKLSVRNFLLSFALILSWSSTLAPRYWPQERARELHMSLAGTATT